VRLRFLLIPAALIGLAIPAAAQSVEVTGGIALTSNYVSSGHSFSNEKAAIQGYVEGSASGAYAGLWMSSMNDGVDKTETDLSLGYRNELANGLSYDFGYTRYLYNNSGNCCGDFALAMAYPLSDAISAGGKFIYDPSSKAKTLELSGDYTMNDALHLTGTLGKEEKGAAYGDIGATYNLSEKSSVDLRYHNASDDKGRLVLGLAFDTTLLSR
jgi:uncharacterized protein (TIGR02001 family)